jgi:hypothetical protein
MTDMNRPYLKNDELDRELNAALTKFAAVEPRRGLEDRILVNLRAERQHNSARTWWRWPVVAALAALIVVAVSISWRSAKVPYITTQHPPAPTNEYNRTQTANNNNKETRITRPHNTVSKRRGKHAVSHPATVLAPAPRLGQFPSPQPLSEQEEILARYVARFPEHAALIALARTEELQRDTTEEMAEAASASR